MAAEPQEVWVQVKFYFPSLKENTECTTNLLATQAIQVNLSLKNLISNIYTARLDLKTKLLLFHVYAILNSKCSTPQFYMGEK